MKLLTALLLGACFWRVLSADAQQRVPFEAQCFFEGEAGSIDRSDTTISLLHQDWSSHELVTYVAAFILKEWLGYNVELVRLKEMANSEEYRRRLETMREGVWDADLESWLLIMERQHREDMLTVVEPLQPIGYSGRSGLYVMPQVLEQDKFADWWKFYLQPGHARSLGFRGLNQTRLRKDLEEKFPVCQQEEYPWCGASGGSFEGFWVPEHCVENISSCVLVEMGEPSWDQGYFEQVVQNLKLPMVFAYLGSDVLSRRRAELEDAPENVVFYSWSSNWGSEFYGGQRISFPDPSAVSVVEGYEQNPDGPVAVDYPDVNLVKLIAKTLFNRAPEAYWMLSRLSVSRQGLLELLGEVPALTQEERMRSACEFLKSSRARIADLAPPCATNSNSDTVFDGTTGLCSQPASIQKTRCFDEPPIMDNSKLVIRLGQRDWLSHDLMRVIAGILLSERLGYSVRFEDISSIPAKEWATILEGNQMDAEMESWQVDIFDPAIKLYLDGSGVIHSPKEIGWTGREGLFFIPDLVENVSYADFYKFYEGPDARMNGFKVFNATEVDEIRDEHMFCPVGSQNPWCQGEFSSNWWPHNCQGAPCIEASMGSPLWAQGTFEQLASNNNLSIAFAYYGGKQRSVVESLAGRKIPSIFYGYTPSEFASAYDLKHGRGRISFPDFFQGCTTLSDRSPNGPRNCDLPPTVIWKLRRKDLAVRAPEAAYMLDYLQVSQEQVEALLSMHKSGRGNFTTEEAACWFVKTQKEAVDLALPECIANPIANPKIGDIVWSAAELSCVKLSCPRNATLIYDGSSGFARCRVCSTDNAGTVPAADQMSCTPCPAGTQPDALGENCQACPPGRYAQEAATPSCQACPMGRYNPLPRQSRCAVCPRGAICTGGYNGTAATSFYADAGFYLLGEQVDVVGHFQTKMLTCADCWDSEEPFLSFGPFQCPVASACRGNNTCLMDEGQEAMEGPLCGSCTVGFQRTGPEEPCSRCPPDWLTLLVIVIVSLGGMLGLCVLSWSQDVSHGNLRGVYSIVLKILCNFFVQLKAVGQVTDLNGVIKDLGEDGITRAILTSPIALSLGIGDVLENPSTSIFSLECLMMSGGTSVSQSLYLKVLGALLFLPACLLLTFLVVAAFTVLWAVCHRRPKRPRERSLKLRILLSFSSIGVLQLYFLQPMVTSQLLSVYNCQSTDEGGGLLDTPRWSLDMSVDCSSAVHQRWQLVTAVGLLLWSFGIPFLLYLIPKLILKWTSYTLQSREMWNVFGFLYDGFEPDFWYYESWMMLRKTYILIAANIFWLSPETRTVVLLTLVIYFRYMHLRDLPYDNRAYMGVDKLQFQSLATFTWILLGRLFRTTLQATDNAIPEEYSPIFYLPAAINFLILVGRATYLVIRDLIWPLQSPPTLLPQWLRNRLDHRVTFSFIPPAVVESDQRHHFLSVEHGSLSGQHMKELAEDWSLTTCAALPNQEREILKTILTETAEVLLRRHEIVHGEGAQVIYLPTFLLQMERVIVAAMCYAVKSRIINEEVVLNRDTWGKWMYGLWEDSISYLKLVVVGRESDDHNNIMRQRSSRSWEDQECDHLREAQHLVRRPVSTEEIQIALYSLWPDLTDPSINKKHSEKNHLRELVHAHRGIVDMHGEVSHIFDSDGHANSILRRRNRTVRSDDSVSVTSGCASDATQTNEFDFAEESDGFFQREVAHNLQLPVQHRHHPSKHLPPLVETSEDSRSRDVIAAWPTFHLLQYEAI
ncbi:unnamed protein product [Durusdinium trenchii]|uniref:Tyrosine-protein kinase ephrin type A/B receptor-like domain-containing protein n=1 Tax=Durusdinium trenchii TaxID=1381693 RepID=A0ABP0SKT2_9DINO